MENDYKKILQEVWFPFLLEEAEKKDNFISTYMPPLELEKKLATPLLEDEPGQNQYVLKQILQEAASYTPRSQCRYFLGYLYNAPDPIGLIGDWLVSLINSNVHVYEASPVFSLAELSVVKLLAGFVGYGKEAEGIFCPGGSYSNLLAMHLARQRYLRKARQESKRRLVLFTSEQSHYSISKAAQLIGLGQESVILVSCDEKGRMIPQDLENRLKESIRQGQAPFFVNATAGTTVLGSFDPILEIRNIVEDYPEIWLHVDASWGGAVMITPKRRSLVGGIERSDSVTWCLHKALCAPILCSSLLVREKGALQSMFEMNASYLFHNDEEEDMYNLGQKTAQCGRRADAFKFWLMWKMHGRSYFTERVEKSFHLVRCYIDNLLSKKCFYLYDREPSFYNVCFWYIPHHLRGYSDFAKYSTQDKAYLDFLTRQIYLSMKRDGRILVNYAQLAGYPAFFRLIVNHSNLQEKNIEESLSMIENLGNIVSQSLGKTLVPRDWGE